MEPQEPPSRCYVLFVCVFICVSVCKANNDAAVVRQCLIAKKEEARVTGSSQVHCCDAQANTEELGREYPCNAPGVLASSGKQHDTRPKGTQLLNGPRAAEFASRVSLLLPRSGQGLLCCCCRCP